MRLISNSKACTGALIIAVVSVNGVWQNHSFAMGFAHPLLGVDHIALGLP